MSGILDGPTGATPLTAEDFEGLIPTWIATKSDLNRAEQANIAIASVWAFGRKLKLSDLTQGWLKELHRRMFDEVWRWAGSYRQKDTNIGVPWSETQTSVEQLILDLRAQTQDLGTQSWSLDEIAVRFHHRLVSIHPFPNGNGRHARLAADVIVVGLGGDRFGWGADIQLYDVGPARDEYLAELRRADRGDYEGLIAFARRVAAQP